MQINVLSSEPSGRAMETMEERDKLSVFPIVLIRRSQHCNRYKIGLLLSVFPASANRKSIAIIRDILLIY